MLPLLQGEREVDGACVVEGEALTLESDHLAEKRRGKTE